MYFFVFILTVRIRSTPKTPTQSPVESLNECHKHTPLPLPLPTPITPPPTPIIICIYPIDALEVILVLEMRQFKYTIVTNDIGQFFIFVWRFCQIERNSTQTLSVVLCLTCEASLGRVLFLNLPFSRNRRGFLRSLYDACLIGVCVGFFGLLVVMMIRSCALSRVQNRV